MESVQEPCPEDIQEMADLIRELYPICRSITGNGTRRTLQIIQSKIPLEIHEVPSGTKVFDWTVPKEWNIRDAFIKNPQGEKVVEFAKSNLHVVGYSTPFRGKLPLQELKNHLFTLPDHPQWVPYRTSYYKESWGFCLSHEQLLRMEDGDYDVLVDTSLDDGHLTYGEYYLPGESPDEFLLSCHICHPSLCNDNLSGISAMVALATHLRSGKRRYSYRFLFVPGTIGSITWLALHESQVSFIKNGLVISGVGDAGGFTYKKSRCGDSEIDRIFDYLIRGANDDSRAINFFPYGYDERQYCSPGFNLPVGCVMRTPFGQYPEYHTSADDLNFIKLDALADSLNKCKLAIDILENNCFYVNQNPKCEPQLGKRGLYQAIGGESHERVNEMAMLWVLNLSDGAHSLLDIAEKADLPFVTIKNAADALSAHRLLKLCQNKATIDAANFAVKSQS
jgi:aminopeptidase-like protein